MQSGKSTTLLAAMNAADRRLTDQGWVLVGRPLVSEGWQGKIYRDEFTKEVIPGSMRRLEAETGGEIIAVRWGDVPTLDGAEVEGVLLDSTAIEELRGRVIERRRDEPWEDVVVRAKKLVDDQLRRTGWMLSMAEED
jgi:hypothetical protein